MWGLKPLAMPSLGIKLTQFTIVNRTAGYGKKKKVALKSNFEYKDMWKVYDLLDVPCNYVTSSCV